MAPYTAFKIVHMLGIVLFLGNIIVTGVWKAMADRTKNPAVIGFAQRLVTLTDWVFTFGGAILVLAGGLRHGGGRGIRPEIGLAALGANPVRRVRLDLDRDPHSRPDSPSPPGARLRKRRRGPAALLAAEPALVHLGRSRNRNPARQPLCDGREAVSKRPACPTNAQHACSGSAADVQ